MTPSEHMQFAGLRGALWEVCGKLIDGENVNHRTATIGEVPICEYIDNITGHHERIERQRVRKGLTPPSDGYNVSDYEEK